MLDSRHAHEVVRLFEWGVIASFNDAVSEGLSNFWQAVEVITGCRIGIEAEVRRPLIVSLSDFIFLVFEPLDVSFNREFVPIGGGPNACASFRGLEFNVLEDFLISFSASIFRTVSGNAVGWRGQRL